MDLIKKSCALTGHRTLGDDFDKSALKNKILELVKEQNVGVFYCGMAKGFDTIACEILADIKDSYNVKIIACIPCPEQDKYFSEKDKKKYEILLDKCDEIKVVSDHYFKGCMQVRNKFMVDRCDVVLGYVKEQKGGTIFTVKYALKMGKNVILL